ncbi:MAG: extracellular matrix/biofilm biosynthesis regulator RemA family protein [Cyanobacteria bacterium J06649_4]
MDKTFIDIGFANMVAARRIISIVDSDSAPIRRMISEARGNGQLIDATCGRRTRTVLVIDSGHVVLSAIRQTTVVNRFIVK